MAYSVHPDSLDTLMMYCPSIEQQIRKARNISQVAHTNSLLLAINNNIYKEQRDYINSKHSITTLDATRRSGKTTAAVIDCVCTCLMHPGSSSLYITLSETKAVLLLHEVLNMLKLAVPNFIFTVNQKLHKVTINKSHIYYGGLDNTRSLDRYLGHKYHKVVIDEAQEIENDLLELAIEKTLKPTLGESGGLLRLVGTPHRSCSGIFFDYIHTYPQSHFHFSQINNPYFQQSWTRKWENKDNSWLDDAKEWLEQERIRLRFEPNDGTWLREYLGLWTKDASQYIHKITTDNIYTTAPNYCQVIMAIDTGFNDNYAVLIAGYNSSDNILYVLDEHQCKNSSTDYWADKASEIYQKWQPTAVVIDPAYGGKSLGETLRQRYNIACYDAKKSEKRNYIDVLNNDIRLGLVKVKDGTSILNQLRTIAWDKSGKREQEGIECDLWDCLVYLHRYSYHYLKINDSNNTLPTVQDWLQTERTSEILGWD